MNPISRRYISILMPLLLLSGVAPIHAVAGRSCAADTAGAGEACQGQDGVDESASSPATADNTGSQPKSPARLSKFATEKRLHDGLEWEYCGPRPARLGPPTLPAQPGRDDPLTITADGVSYDQDSELLTLTGDVEFDQGARQIRADKITYAVVPEQVNALGDAFISRPGMRMTASELEMSLSTDQGQAQDVLFRFTGSLNARGSAAQAELINPDLTRFQDILYTTCRPGTNYWTLEASKLEIDQDKGEGVARHATLRVADIPVLYTPYISFPIDDRRKSGLLIPSLGNSSISGLELMTPYYWNIAPNMDATFFPRYMSKRGLMVGAEYRFLTPKHAGEVHAEGIANDSDYEGDDPRGALRLLYNGKYGSGWSSYINFNAVSDDEYLEDFGNRLDVTSVRNIERRGDLRYSTAGWYARARLQDFQTVDRTLPTTSRPYGRLPQLALVVNPYKFGSGIEIGMDSEYDYFKHEIKVHGHRAAIQPYAAWPIRRSYGHIIPRLNLHAAAYNLRNQSAGDKSSPAYAIPSINLDGKLIFERTTNWLGDEALQTLEPRLFYLLTPYVNQDDQPTFDSSELTFSYASLFRPNRFTGRDRVGDANQLTLGLTSRTLATETGHELFRASVGQILYFRDRDVQIRGPEEDQGSSAIAGEFSARILTDWTGRASIEWDPNKDKDQSEKRVLELHYETADERLVNLAYRFDLGTTEATRYEDTDVSVRWPVTPRFEVIGRWYYSLLYSKTLEAFAGVEYGSCCWSLRLIGRHYKNKPDSAGANTIMVQLELAGLGNFGHRIEKFLERGIYGYHAD